MDLRTSGLHFVNNISTLKRNFLNRVEAEYHKKRDLLQALLLPTSAGGTSLQNLLSRKGCSTRRSWTHTISFFRVILQYEYQPIQLLGNQNHNWSVSAPTWQVPFMCLVSPNKGQGDHYKTTERLNCFCCCVSAIDAHLPAAQSLRSRMKGL